MRHLFDSHWFVHVRLLVGHFENSLSNLVNLLDDLVEDCFWVVVLLANEDVSHPLGDELERLHIVLVLVKVGDVVL